MTGLVDLHDEHGATYRQLGGHDVVDHYGRPERTHRAVRKGAGLFDVPTGVLAVTGDDRHAFVDDAVSNAVPTTDGRGVYALLCSPQGRIETDMYVFNAGNRFLVFVPPGEAEPLAETWSERTFIQDVDIDVVTEDFDVFGVYGPNATETIASVFAEGTPEQPLAFVRGSMGRAGVTVIRDDGLTGEEGYLVVCESDQARDVFDSLENRGMAAVPFGYRTWETLTIEAGTPLFETELAEHIPNHLGLRNAIDFEKGCFVGQEVVSRIENRGKPGEFLVGLVLDREPEPGAAVFEADASVGEVTRAAQSPTLETTLALALVDAGAGTDLAVRIDGEAVAAERRELPFVEGSDRSARIPSYPNG